MGFDDTFRQFMDKFQMPDFSAVDWKGSVDRLRQQFYVASRAIERDAPEMANISLITIPGPGGPMKARIYTPSARAFRPVRESSSFMAAALCSVTWTAMT